MESVLPAIAVALSLLACGLSLLALARLEAGDASNLLRGFQAQSAKVETLAAECRDARTAQDSLAREFIAWQEDAERILDSVERKRKQVAASASRQASASAPPAPPQDPLDAARAEARRRGLM